MKFPFYDINNAGADTPAIRAKLKQWGALQFHATVTPGADPKAVERELLMAFDRMEYGANLRVYPKPSIFGRIADHFRVWRYNTFREKKALREIDALLSQQDTPNSRGCGG